MVGFEAGLGTNNTLDSTERPKYICARSIGGAIGAVLWIHILCKRVTYRLTKLTVKAGSCSSIYRGLLPQQDRAGALRTTLYLYGKKQMKGVFGESAIAPGRQNMSENAKLDYKR